ncbi:membrane protein [Geobacter sulfurreducens]|nr:membrane protein [Geobacter sulfurreducens]
MTPFPAVAALLLFIIILLAPSTETASRPPTVTLYFFWGEGCPHCERAKTYLADAHRRFPGLEIRSYEVLHNENNLNLLMTMSCKLGTEAKGVPTFIIADRMLDGFSDETRSELEREIVRRTATSHPTGENDTQDRAGNAAPLTLPLLGTISAERLSLPFFTLAVATLDSFNPCAFFVLLFLLSLMVHAHSRHKMALIGGVFVFFSGLIYFLFMAAWLNLFLVTGHLAWITVLAAVAALIIATMNVKDFFLFEKGVSLVIPEEAKPRLFERMRNLVRAGTLPAMLAGTVVLALAANSYELLCTAGFPMVFTRVLTLRELPPSAYYLYLGFYNVVYVIPLAVIVGIFTITLGSRKLTEWQGRVLKLVSGIMMLSLGFVLLLRPTLLNNAFISLGIMAASLAVSWVIVTIVKRIKPDWTRH